MTPNPSVSIVTWNINSVRKRLELIREFVEKYDPDVLCLQEIKCTNDLFPYSFFEDLGYPHQAVHGQKAYHGVATLSKIAFKAEEKLDFCGKGDARHVCVTFSESDIPAIDGLSLHNFYVPAGGDVPDVNENDKFDHKLNFLTEMTDLFKIRNANTDVRSLLVGDLNIAPLESDVWSHKQLLKVVSHTPIEVEHMNALQEAGNWVDVVRTFIPAPELLYSWWSYRARDWRKADKGRRLDHIWATPGQSNYVIGAEILKDVRGWDEPSDHAPARVFLTS